MKYGIYRDGILKKSYDSQVSAIIVCAAAKDARPECKWELRPVKRQSKSAKKNEVKP